MKTSAPAIAAMIVVFLAPLRTGAQEEADSACAPLAETIAARSALTEAQVAEAVRASQSIIAAMEQLRASKPGMTIRNLCPELVADITRFVEPNMIDTIIVTGTRRVRDSRGPSADNGEVPGNWRPFTFQGYTYYVVPLDET